MTRRLNVAFIGCGRISRAHLPHLLKTPLLRLVATMDIHAEAAQERARQGGAAYFTTDLQRILGDRDVDAVLICSSHDTHASLVLQACAAGKHIFVEKPLAMTLDEARRIQQTVDQSGVHIMSGWWLKHSPVTQRLREVIRQPYFILFTCRLAAGASDPRPNGPDGVYGANGILDAAGYNLHWIWHVMRSQPVEVFATGFGGEPANTSTIVIRFANGGIGTSIYSTVGTGGLLPKHYAEVLAGPVSAATARFERLVFEGTSEPGIERNRYHDGFDRQMGMFARLCLDTGPNPMDAWEAAVPTLLFEAAVESMRTHRPVPVQIEDSFYLPGGRLPASLQRFGD